MAKKREAIDLPFFIPWVQILIWFSKLYDLFIHD